MNDFKNLNDIFNDSDFEHLIAPLKPMKKIVIIIGINSIKIYIASFKYPKDKLISFLLVLFS